MLISTRALPPPLPHVRLIWPLHADGEPVKIKDIAAQEISGKYLEQIISISRAGYVAASGKPGRLLSAPPGKGPRWGMILRVTEETWRRWTAAGG